MPPHSGFPFVSPNRLTQGRILPSRSLYPVLQNNGTRCHTQAHTAVSVPFPFHCPVTFLKSEDGHMRLQFRLLTCKLLNPSKSSGIFLDLLLCQGNEISVRAVPADKNGPQMMSSPFLRFGCIPFIFPSALITATHPSPRPTHSMSPSTSA